ncbi:MAG: UDP-N-acetylglucosamine 2-epimerase (non-hydrolyzing) [Acidobacteriota bacterium]
MKVMTLFGTRPEIIRLSQVIRQLDRLCEHTVLHTGQNHDPLLSDIFFEELALRRPDVHLGIRAASAADQIGQIVAKAGEVLERVAPDRLLILGDTNSGLAAIPAARLGIPVYHMEAGNRCYDARVPEEVNRRIIDHCSAVLMPYTHRSKENLLREGIERDRIFVVGNPIFEVLSGFMEKIQASDITERLGLERRGYFLATMHRSENVDNPQRLALLLDGLSRVAESYKQPVLMSVHPHTADQLERHTLHPLSSRVLLIRPLGFLDFVRLERGARAVLSDSGTVQEECAILSVPNVTIRDVTERPETIECGATIVSGAEPADILRRTELALALPAAWSPPPEYIVPNVSAAVTKVVLGHQGTTRQLKSF